ncbi:MAG: hypothetical protein WCE90_07120 [Candidatus Zixiibacteriota bacterium]
MNTDFLGLLGIVIAGVVAVGSQYGKCTLWETIIGIILLDLLFCINRTGFHTFFEKSAFSATAGFCVTITIGFFIEKLLNIWPYFDIPREKESERRHVFFFCLWVLLSSIAFFLIPIG